MAIQLNLAGTYLSSNPAANMPNTNSTITLMGWIKYSSWGTAATASIIGNYNGTPTASTAPTTAIQIGARSALPGDVVVWSWNYVHLLDTGGLVTLPANDWIHVAYTCTAISGGNQTHSIYVNGAFINSATNALQVAGVLTQTYINGYPQTAGGTTESNAAMVDGVSLYNRILSANEIETVYSLKGARDNIVNGLVSRYCFDEAATGNVSTCIDYTPNKNNLVAGAGANPPTYVAGFANLNSRRLQ
jgi:hypothetical protein